MKALLCAALITALCLVPGSGRAESSAGAAAAPPDGTASVSVTLSSGVYTGGVMTGGGISLPAPNAGCDPGLLIPFTENIDPGFLITPQPQSAVTTR